MSEKLEDYTKCWANLSSTYSTVWKGSSRINNINHLMILQVGMIEPDQLLGRLRALCTKLDAPALPNDLEEGQEILRYT